jgi:hypothetical protein
MILIVEAMLAMAGRVTILGLSRWTEKGGSYRTVQRFLKKESIGQRCVFKSNLTFAMPSNTGDWKIS